MRQLGPGGTWTAVEEQQPCPERSRGAKHKTTRERVRASRQGINSMGQQRQARQES
jgi:hypothetical protein